MAKLPRIVVVGSLVFDFVARAERLPGPGETILGSDFGMFPGGKGANQAVQAARLGADVFLIGRVGDDLLADRLFESLHVSGVHTDFVRRDPSVKTAACCIHVDSNGNNSIVIVPEANQACLEADVDAAISVIAEADVVLTQLEIPVRTVSHTLQLARSLAKKTILNPAPAGPLPDGLLAMVDVLTPNEIEAQQLCSGSGRPMPLRVEPLSEWAATLTARLAELGSNTAVLTLGESGAFIAAPGCRRHVPAFAVTAVDATAAGDAFSGALAVALAEGQSLDEAVRFANAAGGLATTRPGAQPSLAVRSEVEALLREAPLRPGGWESSSSTRL